jgi:hypothetical protein
MSYANPPSAKVRSCARFLLSARISTQKTVCVDHKWPKASKLIHVNPSFTDFDLLPVVSQEGHEPLHCSLRPPRWFRDLSKNTLDTLQVLVSFGATWCDELVSSGEAREEAPALRICIALWSQDLADGLPLTTIPDEVVVRGADSTQAYIDDLKKSREGYSVARSASSDAGALARQVLSSPSRPRSLSWPT